MLTRRLTALVILLSFLSLAVLSFLGNRLLSVAFIAVAGTVLAHHATKLCPRCSNRHCAFNPRFSGRADDEPTVDLDVNRTTVIPLLATGPLAVIAAWLYSAYWTLAVGAVALTAHFVFRAQTCSHCENRCAGNCNEAYRALKQAQRREAHQG